MLCALTVVTKSGVRFGASLITPTEEDGTGRALLSFLCSGRMTSVPVDEVAAVEFYPGPAANCPMCDSPTAQSPFLSKDVMPR